MPKVSISSKGLTCIYGVLSPTDKIYIGQTWDLYHRYKSGVSKSQRMLYRSYQKHGEAAHKLFTIIEFKGAFTQADLDCWERYYMDVYRAEGYQLLNIREGGGNKGRLSEETKTLIGLKSRQWKKDNPEKTKGIALNAAKANIGKRRSAETKKLQSESAKGRLCTDDHKKNISLAKKGQPSSFKGKKFTPESISLMKKNRAGKGNKPISQLTLNGDLIKEWPSIQDAAINTGIHKGTIAGCVRKLTNYKTAGGYLWAYANESDLIAYQKSDRRRNSNGKAIIQLTIDGEEVKEWPSRTEAARMTGICDSSIRMCCRGTRKSAGGFTWRYK